MSYYGGGYGGGYNNNRSGGGPGLFTIVLGVFIALVLFSIIG